MVNIDNFHEIDSNLSEYGDCDGGKLVRDTTVYLNDDNNEVFATYSNYQIIPGTNTECNTDGLNGNVTASQRWSDADAADPLIADRAPTGQEDGTWSTSFSISASAGTDTSVSGSIGFSYSQPDVYFESKGSTVDTELNYDYTSSSRDTTADYEHSSILDMGETLEYQDVILTDFVDANFWYGPDTESNYTFTFG